jgi:hypothetical protein
MNKLSCSKCETEFYSKESLNYHTYTSKCAEALNTRLSIYDPNLKIVSNESSIDQIMNNLSKPLVTIFRTQYGAHLKPTAYRKHVKESYMFEHEKTFSYKDGDMMCCLYICVDWNSKGSIKVTYGDCVLLDLKFYEIYQIYRTYGKYIKQYEYIDLTKLILAGDIGLPICISDLKVKINDYIGSAYFITEIANLSSNERDKFISSRFDTILYQYHNHEHKLYGLDASEYDMIRSQIQTRYPISDIYHIYQKDNNPTFKIKFNNQELLHSSSPIYNLNPSDTDEDMFLFSTKLKNDRTQASHIGASLLPKGQYIIEGPVANLIFRYVTCIRSENRQQFLYCGLLSKPLKERVYDHIVSIYKKFGHIGNALEDLDNLGIICKRHDSDGVYWEGFYEPTPLAKLFPVPKPTTKPCDETFLNALVSLLPQLVTSYASNPYPLNPYPLNPYPSETDIRLCKFTGKQIEKIRGFDPTKNYWFIDQGCKYSFCGTLLHFYTVLNVHPSEQFYKAVMNRCQYVSYETEIIKNIKEEHEYSSGYNYNWV